MSLTDGTGLSATDIMALTNGNNDGLGGNGGGFGWWVILFILLLGGGMWGNGFAGGGGSNTGYLASDIQRGFDQSAITSALANLSTVVSNGFANIAVDSCNKTMTLMQGQNAIQSDIAQAGFNSINAYNNGTNSILTQMSNYEMARQQCCCDNKLAVADLKSTLLAEHCSDRNEIDRAMMALSNQMNAGFNELKDQQFQAQMDALRRENEQLKMQAYMGSLAASQNAQTQAIFANNQAQTDVIMNYLNPPYARAYPPTAAAAG